MSATFIAQLKSEMKFPTLLQAALILIAIFGIGLVVALLQGILRPVIDNRFALDSASFPFVLGSFERAGSYWNLIGWGYFLNGHCIESPSLWTAEKIAVLALTILFARYLWWGPVAMQAGVVANLLEWHFLGNVLDWIIFPDGALGVRALSLGDILIYGGIVPCVIVLTVRVAAIPRSIRQAFRDAARTGKAQS
ncbi:MAG: hypothetical protein RI988_2777 [Pseudomonadota bacterium]|jgi:hypothetical protein